MASSLERLQQEHSVEITWRSFELSPAGSPPMSPEKRAYIERVQPQMHAMARERYGLSINQGPLGVDSRAALIGEHYARAQGKDEAYHTAVMKAYWQEAQSIDQIDVLADLAVSVGLEREHFVAALGEPEWEDMVVEDIEQARAYGLTGVPAMVFGEKYLVVGAQPYEVLEEATRRCEAGE